MSPSFKDLLDAGDELKVPPGFRVEIIGGNIVLSPWPLGYYTRVMDRVCRQLSPHLHEGHVMEVGPLLYVFPKDERAYEPTSTRPIDEPSEPRATAWTARPSPSSRN